MAYYAFVLPAYIGHLNPMCVLARAMQRRGHRAAILSSVAAEARVRKAGLEFIPIAGREFPEGEWERWTARLGELSGLKGMRHSGRMLALFARSVLRDLPPIAAREQFDGLVMDQISIGCEAVCEVLGLPLAVACNALMMNPDWGVPPSIFAWPYDASLWSRLRNTAGYAVNNFAGVPLLKEVMPYRFRHKLAPMGPAHMNDMRPSVVQVTQQPACFDFPRRYLPAHFHYTGPWTEQAALDDPPFPWERLNGRPLIYASLGTLQNRVAAVYRTIAEACADLEVQLVIALGHAPASMLPALPGDPIVAGYAPQRTLLKRASMVVTHAGLNTTLESLQEGLPLVAIPITNDQPGVAARVQYLGVGEHVPLTQLTAGRLREAVRRVLSSPGYRQRAGEVAAQMKAVDGPQYAAELIEAAFRRRHSETERS